MSGELERARDKLHGDWKRSDLALVLDIGKTKALDLIRNWNRLGVCERVPGTSDRYRWCEAAPTASAAPESLSGDTQTPIQERPRARATRTQPVPAAVWAGLVTSSLSALAGIALVVLMVTTRTETVAQQSLLVATPTPAQFPTATLTAPVIPAWWAPGGDPAPGVDPATIRDYTGRYDDYVQINGDRWIRVQHADGADLASLPDLREPVPTPTARVIIREVEVPRIVREVVRESGAPAPVQELLNPPPPEQPARDGGGGGVMAAPALPTVAPAGGGGGGGAVKAATPVNELDSDTSYFPDGWESYAEE